MNKLYIKESYIIAEYGAKTYEYAIIHSVYTLDGLNYKIKDENCRF